jgi:hypothetical protein
VLDYIPTSTIILVIVYEHSGNALLESKVLNIRSLPAKGYRQERDCPGEKWLEYKCGPLVYEQ